MNTNEGEFCPKSEIPEAARATIAHIEREFERLRSLRDGLREFFGATECQAPQSEIIATPSGMAGTKPGSARVGAGSGGNGAGELRGDAQRIFGVAAKLKQPFSVKLLQTEANIPKSSAGSSIDRWMKRGLVEKVSYGLYQRTSNWPGAKSNGATVPPAAPAARRANVDKLLQDALKQRDHARSNGRDEMAKVFQEEVDRLQGELLGKSKEAA